MPYTSFHAYFPKIAKKETRTMTTLKQKDGIPKGSYGLLEMYCDDPGCDCQRVFLEVYDWERQKSLAFIAYGWESAEFYRAWLRRDDPETIRELQGPILNLVSPQSDLAPAFLKLVQELILIDPNYISRLKRHYQMFKEKVDPKHFREPTQISISPEISVLPELPATPFAPILPELSAKKSNKRHRSRTTDR